MTLLLWAVLPFLVGLAITAAANHLALWPWRKAKDAHWTERARLLFPARRALGIHIISAGLLACEASVLMASSDYQWWPLASASGLVGALLGCQWLSRAIYPSMAFRDWVSQSVMRWGIFIFWIGGFAAAALAMPSAWNWTAFGIAFVYLIGQLWIATVGLLQLLRLMRAIVPASARLSALVDETSRQTGVSVASVWELRMTIANASALIYPRAILFTSGALAELDDNEIRAVCIHEMGHLSESGLVRTARIAGSLALFPLVFLNPAIHSLGYSGLLPLVGLAFAIRFFRLSVERRMEYRADAAATAAKLPEGVYASALLKLYRANLMPAVVPSKRFAHPHLYDRMIAAGVTPDFERPKPPQRACWTAIVLYIGALALLALAVPRVQRWYAWRHWMNHGRENVESTGAAPAERYSPSDDQR